MTRVSLRTVTMNIPSQKIITKDNVSIDIAAVAYYHIVDPMRSVVAVENVYDAVNQLAQTTVRNVVAQFMTTVQEAIRTINNDTQRKKKQENKALFREHISVGAFTGAGGVVLLY